MGRFGYAGRTGSAAGRWGLVEIMRVVCLGGVSAFRTGKPGLCSACGERSRCGKCGKCRRIGQVIPFGVRVYMRDQQAKRELPMEPDVSIGHCSMLARFDLFSFLLLLTYKESRLVL